MIHHATIVRISGRNVIVPFIVLLGNGDHQITSTFGIGYATRLRITCSNVKFVGTGKDTTTILGGFSIENIENITFTNNIHIFFHLNSFFKTPLFTKCNATTMYHLSIKTSHCLSPA